MFHRQKHEGNIYWTYCSHNVPGNSISHKAITDSTRALSDSLGFKRNNH